MATDTTNGKPLNFRADMKNALQNLNDTMAAKQAQVILEDGPDCSSHRTVADKRDTVLDLLTWIYDWEKKNDVLDDSADDYQRQP